VDGRRHRNLPDRGRVAPYTSKLVLKPGPGHPITVEPAPGRVRVTFADRVVVDTEVLERSTHQTYCPYKGDATYYTRRAVNHVAGHVAFYPQHVTIEQLPG
jgi:uncharacterized protein (DUF427 family)